MDKGEVPVGCLIGKVYQMSGRSICPDWGHLGDLGSFIKVKLSDAEEIYRMKERVRSNMLNFLPWMKQRFSLHNEISGLLS